MRKLIPVSALFVGVLSTAMVFAAPDLAREKRMADEIVDTILDGEPIELAVGEHSFMGIFTEAEDEAKGSVLILHGRGYHPDWVNVVQPLRVGLTQQGWNTLSIQMPVLEKTAKYNDYVKIFAAAIPRIQAALNYIQENAPGPVVMVAHSCGFHMAQHWVHKEGDAAVNQLAAFVGIGMGATDYKQPMVEPFALDKMPIPVLDLYAEKDFPAVLRMAPERAAMLKKVGNAKSQQKVVAGAEHYFTDMGDELTEAVAEWLNTL
jgi:hypothetical protein